MSCDALFAHVTCGNFQRFQRPRNSERVQPGLTVHSHCSYTTALAMEILQYRAKLSMHGVCFDLWDTVQITKSEKRYHYQYNCSSKNPHNSYRQKVILCIKRKISSCWGNLHHCKNCQNDTWKCWCTSYSHLTNFIFISGFFSNGISCIFSTYAQIVVPLFRSVSHRPEVRNFLSFTFFLFPYLKLKNYSPFTYFLFFDLQLEIIAYLLFEGKLSCFYLIKCH